MPYEYRALSPEERQRIVQHRRECGFPWHAPPHPFRDTGYYLLSASNFEHVPVMASAERRTDFEARLAAALQEIGAEIAAWTVLPNHYHALVRVETLQAVSATLQHLHGATSREWNLVDGMTGRRRVWYHYSDRLIRGEAHFCRTLNHVHYNAVKHGYVTDPYEWPWQSLDYYLEAHGREWLRAQWKAYPPQTMGKGWDD